MKKISFILVPVCIVILLMFSACGSQNSSSVNNSQQTNSQISNEKTNASKDKIKLKLADSVPITGAFSKQAVQPFMKRVSELTNNKVEFEHYPSEQLGKAKDLFQLTQSGVTDIAYVTAGLNSSKIPLSSLVGALPGIYNSSYQGSMAYHEVIQQSPFVDEYLKNGVRPLFGGTTIPYDIWTKGKEVRVPKDIKGLKVGAGGGSLNELVEFLGGVPVTTPPPEMYESLDRGVIDGQLMHAVIIKDYGLMEIVKYGSQGIKLGGSGFGFIINEKVWQSLPQDVQKALQTAALQIAEGTKDFQDGTSKEIIGNYQNKVKIQNLTPEEQNLWQVEYDKFIEKKIKEYEEKGIPAKKAVQMMKEAASKYNAN